MFIDRKFMEKHKFKLDKLEKPLVVTNVDGSNNSGGRITHKIECNVYYRGHQERMKFDIERGKWGFSYDKQKVNGSGSSPQSRAKGSEGRMTERGDKKD